MLVGAVGLVLVAGYFGDPIRDGIVIGGLLLVLAVPTIVLPAPMVPLLGIVASASLAIYLTHYAVFPELLPFLPLWLVTVACVAVGVGAWLAIERCVSLVRKFR